MNYSLKEFVRRIVIAEGAKTPSEALSAGFVMFDERTGTAFPEHVVILFDPKAVNREIEENGFSTNWSKGVVATVGYRPNSSCPPAKYEVQTAAAIAKGSWGPLVYDYLLAKGPAMSDRHATSPEAQRVWEYYKNNRSDVKKVRLSQKCEYSAEESEDYQKEGEDYLHYAYSLPSSDSSAQKMISDGKELLADWKESGEKNPLKSVINAATSFFTQRYMQTRADRSLARQAQRQAEREKQPAEIEFDFGKADDSPPSWLQRF